MTPLPKVALPGIDTPAVVDFDRGICSDVVQSTQREWMVTNGLGGYGCGTISGILTRCYHGWLVAALNPPVGRSLLLTKLDEVVAYGGVSYPLSCDRWSGGTTTGNGYRNHRAISSGRNNAYLDLRLRRCIVAKANLDAARERIQPMCSTSCYEQVRRFPCG